MIFTILIWFMAVIVVCSPPLAERADDADISSAPNWATMQEGAKKGSSYATGAVHPFSNHPFERRAERDGKPRRC